MHAVPADLLLAVNALAGAAARLALSLVFEDRLWRERGLAVLAASSALSNDVEALRFVAGRMRASLVDRIEHGTNDIAAQSMRLHNLLPIDHVARDAAFDGAAHAEVVAAVVRAQRAA